MSLILDALSRAERDRRAADGVPDLLSPAEVPQRQRRLRWIVVAVLCAVALGAGYLFFEFLRDPAPPVPAATPVAGEASETAVATPAPQTPAAARRAPAPSTAVVAPAPRDTAGDSAAIAALYSDAAQGAQEPPEAAAPASDPAPDAATSGAASAAAPAAANTAAEDESESAAPSTPTETPLDLEELLREARRAQAASGLSEHPVPLLDTLSQQYRDRVPTLMYLRHEYAGDGSTSSVVINGDTLREGQRSGPVQVVEILADSVILRFEGRDFRLRALNSWVNL